MKTLAALLYRLREDTLLLVLLGAFPVLWFMVPLPNTAATWISDAPADLLMAGIVLCRFISNVPAALLPDAFADDWQGLSWCVTV